MTNLRNVSSTDLFSEIKRRFECTKQPAKNIIFIGPAGSGKSTLCHVLQETASLQGRTIKVVNLDPAAEDFKYTCDIDIRDLVSLDDVQ